MLHKMLAMHTIVSDKSLRISVFFFFAVAKTGRGLTPLDWPPTYTKTSILTRLGNSLIATKKGQLFGVTMLLSAVYLEVRAVTVLNDEDCLDSSSSIFAYPTVLSSAHNTALSCSSQSNLVCSPMLDVFCVVCYRGGSNDLPCRHDKYQLLLVSWTSCSYYARFISIFWLLSFL